MKRHPVKGFAAAALCALMLAPTNANAEAQSDRSGVAPALARFNPLLAREAYIASILAEVRQLDRKGDGLDAQDIEDNEMIARAQQRVARMTQIFAFDLNDDGRVERAEIDRSFDRRGRYPGVTEETDRYREQQVSELMRADQNGDGVIDFSEARSRRIDGPGGDFRTKKATDLLALDPNKDGHLTVQELEPMARKAFAVVDRNGDGLISREEFQAHSNSNRPTRPGFGGGMPLPCELPKVLAGQRFVVVGSYSGDALSAVSVAGQDEVTTASRLEIEDGQEPLYILVSSDTPRVWQITGAVARVSRVVVAGRARAGVTGVARDKVTFMPVGQCGFIGYKSDDVGSTMALGNVVRAAGRAPNVIVGEYSFATLKLPSGTRADGPRPERAAGSADVAAVWEESMRFHPGGVSEIDAAAVVAADRVERYDVLPREAGLLQLLSEGSLAYLGDRTATPAIRIGGTPFGNPRGDFKFRIVKPVKRFPAGLNGAHAATFVLAKGVPMPPGNPALSCVVSEDTGLTIGLSSFCK